jgi:myo-inositol 2-dehydrogenase/D-chiro-inositol 1-dehydrogenase
MQSRRSFFVFSAGMAAGLPLSAASPNESVSIACIGVGGRGSYLLELLLAMPEIKVRAICDIDPRRLAAAQETVVASGRPKPQGLADWKQTLELKDVDAVVSALPCDLHAAAYLDTIAAGKDLYGEKPMCLSRRDCDALVAAARASKCIVQIGFQRRADPRFIEAVRLVHAGEIGKLIEGRILWSIAWGPLSDWRARRERSGDWMVEMAVHNWDVMNWANRGLPVKAVGWGRTDLFPDNPPDRNVHDYYSAVVEYPNGVLVNILHSWMAPDKLNDEYTRLVGTRGGVDFNTGVFSYRRELAQKEKQYGAGEVNNTRLSLAAFIDSVRTRKPPIATVEHGRDAVLACLLTRQAVYTRKTVTMEECG